MVAALSGHEHPDDGLGRAPVASRAPLSRRLCLPVDAARSREWAAWGDGALCVPEIVIWRDDEGSEATFIVDTETQTGAAPWHRCVVSWRPGWRRQ